MGANIGVSVVRSLLRGKTYARRSTFCKSSQLKTLINFNIDTGVEVGYSPTMKPTKHLHGAALNKAMEKIVRIQFEDVGEL